MHMVISNCQPLAIYSGDAPSFNPRAFATASKVSKLGDPWPPSKRRMVCACNPVSIASRYAVQPRRFASVLRICTTGLRGGWRSRDIDPSYTRSIHPPRVSCHPIRSLKNGTACAYLRVYVENYPISHHCTLPFRASVSGNSGKSARYARSATRRWRAASSCSD